MWQVTNCLHHLHMMEKSNLHHLHGRSGPPRFSGEPQHHTHNLCYLRPPVVSPAEAPPRFSGDPPTPHPQFRCYCSAPFWTLDRRCSVPEKS
ncbi:hypothetical protein Hdeb2414_s0025g00658501 [Helianthus debilis subsp. tardiflorus]